MATTEETTISPTNAIYTVFGNRVKLFTFKCSCSKFTFERTVQVIAASLSDAWVAVANEMHHIAPHTPDTIVLASEEKIG